MLTLRVLGTLDLHGADGQDLPAALAQPKRVALLAYLCVRAPGGFCRRDTLLALFWPEADTERARTALRGALHFLRRTIGDDVIRTRGDDVGVDPERLTCDATLFEQAIAAHRLDEALTLYRGDLLDGVHVGDAVEFEQWRDDERARLRRAAIDAAKALAAQREAEGDHAGAIRATRRAVALVPDDETLAQRLMVLLDRAGDRAGALRAYDELSARLRASYESDPSPETRELIETIRRRDHVVASTMIASSPAPDAAPPEQHVIPLPSPPAVVPRAGPTRSRVLLATGAVAAMAVIAFATVASFRARSASTATPNSPDVVAVLPFSYEGTGGVSYLGDGMSRLLTTNLNGAGALRVIDPVAVRRALDEETHGRATAGVDSAQTRHIADRFGAGLVVTGQVSEAGGRVRVTADVIARGRSSSQIVVDGTSDKLFELVDDLTSRLVAAWGTAKGQRLTSLAAHTTRSLPALRAYLDGERDFSAGRYGAAVDAYQRAVAADSTFALAYYRLSVALTWTSAPFTHQATRQARRFVGRLSRRDSMLVEARYANADGRPQEAERLYQSLLADYPDEIEAWYQLGEVQYHWAGTLGRPARLSEPAFEHALALDPLHVPAMVHLARLAASARRFGRLDSLRARLASLPTDPAEALEIEALRAFTGAPSSQRTQVSAKLVALGSTRTGRLLPPIAAASEDLDAVLAISHTIDPRGTVFEAALEVARGRWRAANAVLDRIAEQSPSLAAEYRGAFAVATMFPVTATELTTIRAAVARQPVVAGNAREALFLDPPTGLNAAQRTYLLGRLSSRAGDTVATLKALDEARATGVFAAEPPGVATLVTVLRTDMLAREHRASDALQLIGSTPQPVATGLPLMPSFRATDERFLRAELLHDLERDDEALTLYGSFPDPGGFDLVYLAPAHLRQADILEARGDRVAARQHLERFIALWSDCDAELRPMVDDARRRLVALGTRAGT